MTNQFLYFLFITPHINQVLLDCLEQRTPLGLFTATGVSGTTRTSNNSEGYFRGVWTKISVRRPTFNV